MNTKRAGAAAKEVIKGILVIGFSIQIVLGIVWMCCNVAYVQDFAPVTVGIYSLFLHFSEKAYPLVYVVQLLMALGAGYRLCLRLWPPKKLPALWGSLALLTLPMAMQCHLALLPYSFVCSAGLLQISFFCDLCSDGLKRVDLTGILGCYLAQALLLPEYSVLGAVPVAVMLVCVLPRLRAKKRLFWESLLLAAAALLLAAGVNMAEERLAMTGTEMQNAESQAAERSDISGLEWLLAKRVCWPTLWVDSDGLPDKIWEVAGDVLWECTYYPGNMERYFRPALEEALDAEEAKALLREMTANAWRVHYPMIIRQVGWDVLGYGVTPIILPLQLSGDAYESCSGRNYEVMRNRTPALTKHYVNYSCWWFGTALVLTLALAVVRFVIGERPYGKRDGVVFTAALLFAGCAVSWYTLQGAGIMDYKYTIFMNEIWFVWSLKTIGGRSRDGEEGQQR